LICVDTAFQSKGIGSRLISYLSSLANNGIFDSIALEVNKTNLKAYNFYVKQGFIETEDRGKKMLMIKTI